MSDAASLASASARRRSCPTARSAGSRRAAARSASAGSTAAGSPSTTPARTRSARSPTASSTAQSSSALPRLRVRRPHRRCALAAGPRPAADLRGRGSRVRARGAPRAHRRLRRRGARRARGSRAASAAAPQRRRAVDRRARARRHRPLRPRRLGRGRPARLARAAAPRRAAALAGRGGRQGYWSFTRYDDIVAVSKDYATYSSETGGTSLEDLTPSQVEARKSMLDTDPPAHTRMRAIVNKGFTPKVVNAYEERIRGLAREILGTRIRAETSSTGSRTSPPSCRCGSSRRSWACRSRTGSC